MAAETVTVTSNVFPLPPPVRWAETDRMDPAIEVAVADSAVGGIAVATKVAVGGGAVGLGAASVVTVVDGVVELPGCSLTEGVVVFS